MPSPAPEELEARLAALESRVAELEGGADGAKDRAQVILTDVAREVFGLRATYNELRHLSMDDHPGWDSLKQVEFLVALEQHAGVTFNAADLAELTSVAAAYELLRSKL
jgi:acyl carrier protein